MYFTIIPQHVVRNKKLGDARFLYGHILTLSNRLGYCYAPNEFLADILECEVRSVSRYVKLLQEAKLIEVHYAKNNSRTIQPLDTMIGNKLLKREDRVLKNREIDPEVEKALDDLWNSFKVGEKKINHYK